MSSSTIKTFGLWLTTWCNMPCFQANKTPATLSQYSPSGLWFSNVTTGDGLVIFLAKDTLQTTLFTTCIKCRWGKGLFESSLMLVKSRVRIGWTTFFSLHYTVLLPPTQISEHLTGHQGPKFLHCQTCDWWLISTQKEFFSITTGTDKFPKDSDSTPSAFKLRMFISILSYKSRSFFVSCTEIASSHFSGHRISLITRNAKEYRNMTAQ